MKLKMSYKTRDELPKGFEELYDEVDGEFRLTGIEGLKTEGDVTRVQQSLVNERKDHKKTKDALNAITAALPDGMTAEDLVAKIDQIGELEAKVEAFEKKGGDNQEAIDRLVDTKIKRLMAPVERERDQLKRQVGELTGERDTLVGERKKSKIEGTVGKFAQELKVVGSALDDVMLRAGSIFEIDEVGRVVTRDGVDGISPGMEPKEWLTAMQEKAPHWWATSVGGGANGSGKGSPVGGNPWSAKNWNMTQQGQYVREHGMDKAQQLAKQAGTTVGGPMPKPSAA